ncbi:MAG: alpha-galactosidase [Ruminococcus sp.]|nr:alpha-galactosidase [Ruminococcus sp.]
MGISFYEKEGLFQLDTKTTTYLIGIVDGAYVGHVYYGKRLSGCQGACALLRIGEPPFVPSKNEREKASFADTFPFEYSVWGVGDYREHSLLVRTEQGHRVCEPVYVSHRILEGKPGLPGLPATFAGKGGKAETLEIICKDSWIGLKIILRYSVFEDADAVIRSVQLINEGSEKLYVERALSACLEIEGAGFEMLTLTGSWARERTVTRCPLTYGRLSVSSVRGCSSHQKHPFLAVTTPGTTQEQGEVYAMHFVYSGNFLGLCEKSQFDSVRMVMGIHPEGFEWVLEPEASFQTPEVVCIYSDRGLGKMSRILHDLYRNHLIRSPYLHRKRPVLINNWEATYFDFDADKLVEIAREAKKAGIEMLVMDDGWFGRRSRDDSSLGDWYVNEEKLPGGLPALVERIKEEGLSFGIWFEPEMVSPDSELYRAHPDWIIRIPERTPTQSRAQYVLDLSRGEVVDYVYQCVADILYSADISYVKWDMNRQQTDLGSAALSGERQGELGHRYILGVYELQERLVREFPELLLENCASGGGRFDPGMLYYSPQIWCSDDTDAVERLAIQEGTAMLYLLSCIGAHVRACPNHITGRVTPFGTRGLAALAGTFGYELDITKLSAEEKEQIREQVGMYYRYQELIREGDYYRIASWGENQKYDCWEIVTKDGSEVLATYVQVLAGANQKSRRIRLKGLDAEAVYMLAEEIFSDSQESEEQSFGGQEEQPKRTGKKYSGGVLMYGGISVEPVKGDYAGRLLHFIRS